MRNTHAAILIENNANIKYVQYKLNHNNIQTTLSTYTRATKKCLKNMLRYLKIYL
ncbi:tyrosine-type recombinase/integrase [Candidatus Arthromitus sp. SFB-turkey]|uniref:tyrosine-type recombinase/integrase n=1 Tax=Candidatus Arthromitus sp. SFB-turkey TaxID=1840217 RepID=UPI001FA70E0E|nr:tyrosine-type recombinase/integrase [Candidatus Arthromitus sp. SFB-turkey]